MDVWRIEQGSRLRSIAAVAIAATLVGALSFGIDATRSSGAGQVPPVASGLITVDIPRSGAETAHLRVLHAMARLQRNEAGEPGACLPCIEHGVLARH
jgi:hypothetical protein